MKLRIEWSKEGQAVNDFYCEELSEWIADELIEGGFSSITPFIRSKQGVQIEFTKDQAIVRIASELLVNYLRALVKEGRIKEAELWFVSYDKFGSDEINMGLDKNGRCSTYPQKAGYSSNPLMRLLRSSK